MGLPTSYVGSKMAWPWGVSGLAKAADPGRTPGQPGATYSPVFALLHKLSIANSVATSTTAFMSTGVAGPNATTVTYSKGSSQWDGTLGATGLPDFPRNAVVTVTHASSVVAVNGTLTGIDLYGKTITEAWSVTAGGTSKTFTGKKGFLRLDSISIIAAGDASANTVKLGTGKVFGLPFPCVSVVPIGEMEDAALVGTAGVLVAASSAATADARGTYSPNSAPDGAKDFVVYYLVDDPTTATA